MKRHVEYHCPYCGAEAFIRDSAVIYHGKSFGLALICSAYPTCDSFVGCHKDTGLPKGSMANRELRDERKRAHAAFDVLWQQEGMSRSAAYLWLAASLSIPMHACHIGMFTIDQCRDTIFAIQFAKNLRELKP